MVFLYICISGGFLRSSPLIRAVTACRCNRQAVITPGAEGKRCYSLVKFKSAVRRRKTAAENRGLQVSYLGTIYFVWEYILKWLIATRGVGEVSVVLVFFPCCEAKEHQQHHLLSLRAT